MALSKTVKARILLNRVIHLRRGDVKITPEMLASQALNAHQRIKQRAITLGQSEEPARLLYARRLRLFLIGKGKWRDRHFNTPLDLLSHQREQFPMHVQRELERLWRLYRKLNLTALEEQAVERELSKTSGVKDHSMFETTLRLTQQGETNISPEKLALEHALWESKELTRRKLGEHLQRESVFKVLVPLPAVRAYGESELRIVVDYRRRPNTPAGIAAGKRAMLAHSRFDTPKFPPLQAALSAKHLMDFESTPKIESIEGTKRDPWALSAARANPWGRSGPQHWQATYERMVGQLMREGYTLDEINLIRDKGIDDPEVRAMVLAKKEAGNA